MIWSRPASLTVLHGLFRFSPRTGNTRRPQSRPISAPSSTMSRNSRLSKTVSRPWKRVSIRIRPPRIGHRHPKPVQETASVLASSPSRKAGGKPGHPGHRQALLPPTTVQDLLPVRLWQHDVCRDHAVPYAPRHRVAPHCDGGDARGVASELVWGLWRLDYSPGTCGACGRLRSTVEALTAWAGTYGHGRRMVQTFCASVLHVPSSLGAIQQVLHRVTHALTPHYEAIATYARQAAVNYIDETSWFCLNTLQWWWVMASERVAFYMIHPHRSTEAFVARIEEWEGLLVSDGYGVYQHWVTHRQTCLAHLIRTARGLAALPPLRLAACGTLRIGRVATAVSYGHSAAYRRRVAGVVRATLQVRIHQYHDRKARSARLLVGSTPACSSKLRGSPSRATDDGQTVPFIRAIVILVDPFAESRVPRPPLAAGRRRCGHMTQPLQLGQCPGSAGGEFWMRTGC